MDIGATREAMDGGAHKLHAFELIFTPVFFALIGLLIDNYFGTGVLWTVSVFSFSSVGAFIVLYIRYRDLMDEEVKRMNEDKES